MTWAKGAALTLAFVAAVGLGVLIGPRITHRDRTTNDVTASAPTAAAATEDVQPTPKRTRAPRAIAQPMKKAAASTKPTASTRPVGSTPLERPAASPALGERMKPLLNKGADLGIAAEDFNDAEQFATVVHAARNTDIPFMLLKHRTVNERKNLEAAIRELKPDVNAAAEARRAREQAKADISALTTG
jgi:hypothetical protein